MVGPDATTPVKRILRGDPIDAVASKDSLLDPTALDPFAAFAEGELARAHGSQLADGERD